MKRQLQVPLMSMLMLAACTGEDPPAAAGEPSKTAAAEQPSPAAPPPAASDAAEPTPSATAEPPPEPAEVATTASPAEPEPEPDTIESEPAPAPEAPTSAAALATISIQPITASPRTQPWTALAEPAEPLALVDLQAGVLGKAGASWWTLGDADALVAVEMDREPRLPIMGVWPSDAWYIDERTQTEDDFEYIELRLMKLRGGYRWVPQVYDGGGGEQWFHPGTDEAVEPHMSTRSGMLVYSGFDDISRVAGKHDDPTIGEHRGEVVAFFETGAGKIYVISRDAEHHYAQIECEDEDCVNREAKILPLSDWKFDRQVPRGKYSVSVLARSEGREFILHHRGKSGGWLLEALPAGEPSPSGMWASDEGGLWMLSGERLRLRDTQSAWHDVALPAGLGGVSVAVTEDRKRVIVAGVVAGAPKLYATEANAETAAAPSP